MIQPKVTVFIPTYNGEKYLDKILEKIFKQEVNFDYEVLIIDSGSKDKTLEIIKRYQREHEIRLEQIEKKDFGHGKTRNYAAQIAKGEFIVYLSHDAVPADKHWLYEMIKPFELHEKIMGVTGLQKPRPKCVPLLKYEIRSVFQNLGPESGTTVFYKDDFMKNPVFYDKVTFYSDVNSAARREFLINTIPYRDVPYSEDQLFGRDLIEAGYFKAYASRGRVIHSNDLSLGEYKHRMFDEVVGLRRIGQKVILPSFKGRIKLIVFGIMKDSYHTLCDREFSLKRKIYWLIVNPFYHFEKWRGVRLGVRFKLDDDLSFEKYSLERKRK